MDLQMKFWQWNHSDTAPTALTAQSAHRLRRASSSAFPTLSLSSSRASASTRVSSSWVNFLVPRCPRMSTAATKIPETETMFSVSMSFGLIRRDHIQKWTMVVQTAIKHWNCKAKLQKMKGNLPRRPQNISFFYFFYFYLCFLIICVYLFFYVVSYVLFVSMLSFFICFKLFSVLEGNWISNWRNLQLAIHKMFFHCFSIVLNMFRYV